MKKRFSKARYKKRQRNKYLRFKKRGHRSVNPIKRSENYLRRPSPGMNHSKKKASRERILPHIVAPQNFKLLENTQQCIQFFSDIRKPENITITNRNRYVTISLEEVNEIDYSTISILKAIGDNLMSKGIYIRGDFPKDKQCKDYLEESGFLNSMYDEFGNAFPEAEQSQMLFFEKGSKRFSREDNIRISEVSKKIMKHLTGQDVFCQSIRTVLLEICANTLEWSKAKGTNWLLGVKYEEDKVIVTISDVGKGILKSIYRAKGLKIQDLIRGQSAKEILEGAFDKRYGSQSKKGNRNKGLPSIKHKFEMGKISELKVLTNNVMLHFDQDEKSSVIPKGRPWFKGTFYRWIVTKDCIEN